MKRCLLMCAAALALSMTPARAQERTPEEAQAAREALELRRAQGREARERAMEDCPKAGVFALAWSLRESSEGGARTLRISDAGTILPRGVYSRVNVYRMYPAFTRIHSHGQGREFVSGGKKLLREEAYEVDIETGTAAEQWAPGYYSVEMTLDSLQKPAVTAALGEALSKLRLSKICRLGRWSEGVTRMRGEIARIDAAIADAELIARNMKAWYLPVRQMHRDFKEGAKPAPQAQEMLVLLNGQLADCDRIGADPMAAVMQGVRALRENCVMYEEALYAFDTLFELQTAISQARNKLLNLIVALEDSQAGNTSTVQGMAKEAGVAFGDDLLQPWPADWAYDMDIVFSKARTDLARESVLHLSCAVKDASADLASAVRTQAGGGEAASEWKLVAEGLRSIWANRGALFEKENVKAMRAAVEGCPNQSSYSLRTRGHVLEMLEIGARPAGGLGEAMAAWMKASNDFEFACTAATETPGDEKLSAAVESARRALIAAADKAVDLLRVPDFDPLGVQDAGERGE